MNLLGDSDEEVKVTVNKEYVRRFDVSKLPTLFVATILNPTATSDSANLTLAVQ